MDYLHDTLVAEFGKRTLAKTIVPDAVTSNLKYEVRPYQEEAFQRFLLCHEEDFVGKPAKPLHLLFNMATGSGKTLVMAGPGVANTTVSHAASHLDLLPTLLDIATDGGDWDEHVHDIDGRSLWPVSYTHLTLPTICSV